MKPIPEMTDAEKIAHIRRLKKSGVPLDHIKDLMQVSEKELKKIFRPHFVFMTSEELAKKITFLNHV